MEDVTALSRTCTQCKQDLPLTAYYRDKRVSSGYRSNCKTCHCAAVMQRVRANPEARTAYQAAYRATRRDEAKKRTAQWRLENPGRAAGAMEAYRARPANQEKARDRARAFRLANPQLRSEYQRRRRALKKSTELIGFIRPETLRAKLAYWGFVCWMCRTAPFEAWDHVKPLARGGAHVLSNLRPACTECNARKRDAWPYPTSVRRVAR